MKVGSKDVREILELFVDNPDRTESELLKLASWTRDKLEAVTFELLRRKFDIHIHTAIEDDGSRVNHYQFNIAKPRGKT